MLGAQMWVWRSGVLTVKPRAPKGPLSRGSGRKRSGLETQRSGVEGAGRLSGVPEAMCRQGLGRREEGLLEPRHLAQKGTDMSRAHNQGLRSERNFSPSLSCGNSGDLYQPAQ